MKIFRKILNSIRKTPESNRSLAFSDPFTVDRKHMISIMTKTNSEEQIVSVLNHFNEGNIKFANTVIQMSGFKKMMKEAPAEVIIDILFLVLFSIKGFKSSPDTVDFLLEEIKNRPNYSQMYDYYRCVADFALNLQNKEVSEPHEIFISRIRTLVNQGNLFAKFYTARLSAKGYQHLPKESVNNMVINSIMRDLEESAEVNVSESSRLFASLLKLIEGENAKEEIESLLRLAISCSDSDALLHYSLDFSDKLDHESILKYIKKSAEFGNLDAMLFMGEELSRNKDPKKKLIGFGWIFEAADRGHIEAVKQVIKITINGESDIGLHPSGMLASIYLKKIRNTQNPDIDIFVEEMEELMKEKFKEDLRFKEYLDREEAKQEKMNSIEKEPVS